MGIQSFDLLAINSVKDVKRSFIVLVVILNWPAETIL
jgi:hypothetical protein